LGKDNFLHAILEMKKIEGLQLFKNYLLREHYKNKNRLFQYKRNKKPAKYLFRFFEIHPFTVNFAAHSLSH